MASTNDVATNKVEFTKQSVFYEKEPPDSFDAEAREKLRVYMGLPEEKLETHLHEMRDKAWDFRPYPCIGMWSFLRPTFPQHPKFEVIKNNAKSAKPGSYLICDVGAGLGQELRTFAIEGVPIENLRATDLGDDLWKCGLDFFRDRDRMDSTSFISANILEAGGGPLAAWHGQMDVTLAMRFLHCFDWDGQVIALGQLMRLLKPQKGSMVVGRHLGGPGRHIVSGEGRPKRFFHNTASFKDLLTQVDPDAETKWELETHISPLPEGYLEKHSSWMAPEMVFFTFSLVRE